MVTPDFHHAPTCTLKEAAYYQKHSDELAAQLLVFKSFSPASDFGAGLFLLQ
jgi:hypothetical protein